MAVVMFTYFDGPSDNDEARTALWTRPTEVLDGPLPRIGEDVYLVKSDFFAGDCPQVVNIGRVLPAANADWLIDVTMPSSIKRSIDEITWLLERGFACRLGDQKNALASLLGFKTD